MGKRSTAAALAFAAGVLLWVAFIDVVGGHAKELIELSFDHGHEHAAADGHGDENELQVRMWTALFFFVGLALTVLMDMMVDRCFGHSHPGHHHDHGEGDNPLSTELAGTAEPTGEGKSEAEGEGKSELDKDALMKVSLVTILGVTLHNLPEGLAVFLTSSDSNLLIVIAIAAHNVPLGAAIAMSVYQATLSYAKAFQAITIPALAQPLAAGLGWLGLVLAGIESTEDFVTGALYAITGGIMIGIALYSLLPSALGMESPPFVSGWIFFGFLVMESSIILITATGGHSH